MNNPAKEARKRMVATKKAEKLEKHRNAEIREIAQEFEDKAFDQLYKYYPEQRRNRRFLM